MSRKTTTMKVRVIRDEKSLRELGLCEGRVYEVSADDGGSMIARNIACEIDAATPGAAWPPADADA